MSLLETMEKDLDACFSTKEFAVDISHFFEDKSETLSVMFDEKTDVIMDRGEYEGIEATVPSFVIQTSKSSNINHKSIFVIGEENFGVIYPDKKNDETTVVYLERL